jgi:hypothetical protein
MKRTIVLVLAVATLAVTVVACTPRDSASWGCLDNGRPVYVVPEIHPPPWPMRALDLPNGTAIDARGDVWDNSVLNSSGYGIGSKFHQEIGMRDDLCMVGGTFKTTIEPENTPWLTWHRVYGMFIEVDNFTLIGTSFYNQGDMISFTGADNWKLIGIRAEGPPGSAGAYIHDDCIENDTMKSGLVDDSKFDGCNIFLSSDNTTDGSAETVEVRDSLVRLQKYRNNFDTAKYGENTHGGFFKFASPNNNINPGTPPHLIVKNSVFRADQRGVFGGNENGFLGLPPGTECDNVMLIGTEVWRATDLASWQSQCTNLTYGTIVDWNARVAAWDADHPRL